LIDEKWYYLVEEIEEKFGVEEKNVEEIPERRTKVETVVFMGAAGKMKLERTSKAVVLDKQMKYSRRIGGETQEKYVYSDSETSYRVQLYKWDEATNTWEEIEFRKLRTG